MLTKFLFKRAKGREHSEDLGKDGIALKEIMR
jgi:hypothetical protein